MLASRVRKARRTSTCPSCHAPVLVGQHIGLTDLGWLHTTCIVRENSHDPLHDPPHSPLRERGVNRADPP